MTWAHNNAAAIIQIDNVPGREQLRESNELAGTAIVESGPRDHDRRWAILPALMKRNHATLLSCLLVNNCTTGDDCAC